MRNPCVHCPVSLIYTPPRVPYGYKKPLYTNNAMVFYKPGTVSSSSTGGVSNYRAVARRT